MRFIPKVLRFTIAGAVLAWPLVAAQRFEISFPKEASAAPLDGHVMLVISTQEKPEPRFQISFTRQSQQAFGVDVDGLAPGAAAVVDSTTLGCRADSPAPRRWWTRRRWAIRATA